MDKRKELEITVRRPGLGFEIGEMEHFQVSISVQVRLRIW